MCHYCYWRFKRLKKYGLTSEDYIRILAEQNGVCGLCEEPFGDAITESPAIDHDHATNAVRGVLHRRCNLAIGSFRDNRTTILKAYAYLSRARVRVAA